jgi:hypothetical protein
MVLIGLTAITKELVLACRQLGLVVSEILAAFIASTVVNTATGTFYVEKNLEENDARVVVEESVKKLFSKQKPSVECLKLQASYDSAFAEIDKTQQQTKNAVNGAEERVIEAIVSTGSKFEQDFDSMTGLYRKIFHLLILKCTSPTGSVFASKDPVVEREVAAALESVFPRVGLRSFVALTGPEKAAQLQELCSIVLGIRIFNAHLGKGGQGLPVLEDSLQEVDTTSVSEAIQKEVDESTDVCKELSDFLTICASGSAGADRLPSEDDAEKVRGELLYHRQYLTYMLSLQEDVTSASERAMKDRESLSQELVELDALVGARTSVPKDQVYPRFDSVARIFKTAWSEIQVLKSRKELLELLQKHKSQYFPQLDETHVQFTHNNRIEAGDAEEVDLSNIAAPPPMGADQSKAPIRLTLDNTPDFLHLPLDFQGFCIHTLVSKGSLLVPGNPALGVVHYQGRYCVFQSEKAMAEFCESPEKAEEFFVGIRKVCYKRPELIHLLRLHEDFPKSSLFAILQGTAGLTLSGAVVQADAATETPLHFVEANKAPDYEWNEWAMRRDALHIADIRRKKTSSTHTVLSHLRRENETQVYLPKDAATNTSITQGTNPEQWRTYVTGLRGGTDYAEMKVVNLKFEL